MEIQMTIKVENESWNSAMFMQQWKLSLEVIFQSIYPYMHVYNYEISLPVCACMSPPCISFLALFLPDKQFQFRLVMFYRISQMWTKKKIKPCTIHWNNIYFVSLNNICTCCFNLSTIVWPPFSLPFLLIMSYCLSSKHSSLLWFLTLVIHVSSISRSRTYLSFHKLNWISYLVGSQKYRYSTAGSRLLADIK